MVKAINTYHARGCDRLVAIQSGRLGEENAGWIRLQKVIQPFIEKSVRTGHMVDTCAGTWWTLFGEFTSPENHHALEHERCHEPERRVRCLGPATRE